MNLPLLAGSTIVVVFLALCVFSMALVTGWRNALTVWGIAVAGTALVAYGSHLIDIGLAR